MNTRWKRSVGAAAIATLALGGASVVGTAPAQASSPSPVTTLTLRVVNQTPADLKIIPLFEKIDVNGKNAAPLYKQVGGKFVIILDILRVLSVEEMALLSDVGGHAASATEAASAPVRRNVRPSSFPGVAVEGPVGGTVGTEADGFVADTAPGVKEILAKIGRAHV